MVILFSILSFLVTFTLSENCKSRNTDEGSVCVCNVDYCDTVPGLNVASGKYQVYSSSKARLGFNSASGTFAKNKAKSENLVNVNRNAKYQSIVGFGGAFTDATGINIRSLPKEAQSKLVESYFGKSGVAYSLCRIPIGGTDFSTRAYSYDDVKGDTTLKHFALQKDDFKYKILFIHKANALRDTPLTLFATAWTAPPWMKTNNDWPGKGFLKTEYYQLWADYIVKFFEEYEKNDIKFWGLTTQNEPMAGFTPKSKSKLNAMGWTAEQMNQWIGENLGPTIRNSSFKHLKIILHDDQRLFIPLLQPVLNNTKTISYVDGVAVHWYTNEVSPPSALDVLKIDKENWFILSTEACEGFNAIKGTDKAVRKGSWERGEHYIKDILENLEHGAVGWVDWNMVLDESGGPNYINNFVDSPILVNKTLGEFYKQPMFYGLGHFSKFVVPDSVRIKSSVNNVKNVKVMAFLRPDNLVALIVYNTNNDKVNIQIEDDQGQTASIEIEARSINTVLYKQNKN